jgi:hypothetical protein
MSNSDDTTRESAPPQQFQELLQSRSAALRTPWCEFVSHLVDEFVGQRCGQKHNRLDRCNDEGDDGCPCLPDPGGVHRVDLVVLIDGTLNQLAPMLAAAANQAVQQASHACPGDLRVQQLVVDRVRPGTGPSTIPAFGPSHEQYLNGIGVGGPFAHDAPTGGTPALQQGADAINDISRYYNWRPGACRVIYYVSNAPLDAGPTQDLADQVARAAAVAQATASQVAVFAHLVTPVVGGNQPATQADYQALCSGTGGALSVGPANQGSFMERLVQAICRECPPRCVDAAIPDLRPCVSISWGDSRCDCMETDDTEVLCITVCNCYSNVTLRDLTIGFVFVTDANGAGVPVLPDGTASVDIRPLGPLCFGDIPPCRDGRPGCVSREVVLIARGARPGGYQVQVGAICYSASFDYQAQECFRLQLCRD